jgi:catechol 2,3-dioxygenase-like lactoylglutathione lyase family enzyme
MSFQGFILTISSHDPDRLRDFYRDVVGLVPLFDFTPGAFGLNAESQEPFLLIEEHSEVGASVREPERMLLNFLVDDIAFEESRLRSGGVEFDRAANEEPGVGMFATFRDPDGNLCQLVQLFG